MERPSSLRPQVQGSAEWPKNSQSQEQAEQPWWRKRKPRPRGGARAKRRKRELDGKEDETAPAAPAEKKPSGGILKPPGSPGAGLHLRPNREVESDIEEERRVKWASPSPRREPPQAAPRRSPSPGRGKGKSDKDKGGGKAKGSKGKDKYKGSQGKPGGSR